MDDVIEIHLNERWVECCACGGAAYAGPGPGAKGLPMYEGEILPNDHEGEWGGFAACESCWTIHDAGGPRALYAHLEAMGSAEEEVQNG